MIDCPRCKKPNTEPASNCVHCGTALHVPSDSTPITKDPKAMAVLIGIAVLFLGLVAAGSWFVAGTSAWPWIPGVLVVIGIYVFRDVVRRTGQERTESLIMLGIVALLFITWIAVGARKYYESKQANPTGFRTTLERIS